ncbi:MAG: hypothetical protein ACKOAR_04355, partial [Bacteroidota bacterium]
GHERYIRLTNWEYWPFGIVQAPVFVYWLWLSVKARSPFFFSASNPGILTGGMMGESKFDVLNLVPETHRPKTILIRVPVTMEALRAQLAEAGLTYPCVFKPELGERGWKVKIIRSDDDANAYLGHITLNFLAQEYVDAPLEFGVYYVRKPEEENGQVVSITGKEMLAVTGDGHSTLRELVLARDRARLQSERLAVEFADRWEDVIAAGEQVVLNRIGNHCLGTCFLDAGHLINDRLNSSFDRLSKQVPGFYFGRYDLVCNSETDLTEGRVMVLELNGCGAEPAHIYHPGASFWKAVGVLIRHMRNLYEVSVQNHRRGVPYLSIQEGRRIYRQVTAIVGK